MAREFFMETERIGFSKWQEDDLTLAETLWGNQQVTQYICAPIRTKNTRQVCIFSLNFGERVMRRKPSLR